MKEQGCPYQESCPIFGSLKMINSPSLADYCLRNYFSCRSFQSRNRLARVKPEEVFV